MRTNLTSMVGGLLAGALLISACGSKGPEPTPTLSPDQIQTQAVATFAAAQTQTALAMPTETPTPTPTATTTPTLPAAGSPTPAGPVILPTASCYGMAFVADVTIPDNTPMTPGQKFTKTWRVKNNGSCAWPVGSKLSFTGGEAMGGSAVTLDKAVDVGKDTELSVAMTAPDKAGTYRGNWRMVNPTGGYFGDEIYLIIVVGGTTTVTPTSKATSAPTVTPTATEAPTATEES